VAARRPLPLPSPGDSYQGASGGIRVVCGLAALADQPERILLNASEGGAPTRARCYRTVFAGSHEATHVYWRAEGKGPYAFTSLAAWRLWQRSAKRVSRA
jgi:hypothetical protein